MRAYQLLAVLDEDAPICIEHGYDHTEYDKLTELLQDTEAYNAVKMKKVRNVWYSKNYYGCLVVKIE